jgi:hypothetical protein
MSITIGKYNFDGPYTTTDNLYDRSGIYAILDKRNDGKYYPIDVGESATVKTRVENHDRQESWKSNQQGTLTVAVYYTPNLQQSGRMVVEQEIRGKYDIPCGVR